MAGNVENGQDAQHLARKLAAAGWGAFFIWTGIAFLTNVSWGAGLLGIGVIVLAGEAARKLFGLALDWFWVLVGVVFALWGVCGAFRIQLGGHLWPILSIALGMAILLTGFRTRTREH